MNLGRQQGGIVIVLTFVAAMLLTIMPLPNSLQAYRPDWVALVLIYWCMALPQRVGVGIGWLVGLLLDVLTGTLLGQNAMGLALVAYLTLKLYQRTRLYPVWQQALTVLMLLSLHQLLVLWVNGIIGRPLHSWLYWIPSITGMLFWPLVFRLLRGLRRGFRVA